MSIHEKPVLKMAPPYDDALIRRIEEGFSSLLGFPVQFEVIEAPALLSGFIAYINGTVYDASSKTLLADVKKHLLDSVLAPPAPVKEADDS